MVKINGFDIVLIWSVLVLMGIDHLESIGEFQEFFITGSGRGLRGAAT
jgi:hypothetical protein